MYPHHELNRLAAHKVALRREIARGRIRCAEAASRATQLLVWLDRVMAFGRRIYPLALPTAMPASLVFQRIVFPRLKFVGTLVRGMPLLFAAVRGLRAK